MALHQCLFGLLRALQTCQGHAQAKLQRHNRRTVTQRVTMPPPEWLVAYKDNYRASIRLVRFPGAEGKTSLYIQITFGAGMSGASTQAALADSNAKSQCSSSANFTEQRTSFRQVAVEIAAGK